MINRFLTWCSFSALGHIVLFEVTIAAPLLMIVSVLLALNARLSASVFGMVAAALAVTGAAIALVTWFAVTRPLIRKK